jgi:hypothetical protein
MPEKDATAPDWEGWEEHVAHNSQARLGIYVGREIRAEIGRRAELTDMSVAAYSRECIKRFMRLNATDADPRG